MRTVMKPAGLPVFPPHNNPDGDCVLARLSGIGAGPWPLGFDGGIAHRLDHWTSGALLVADSPDELARIRAAFAAHSLRKTYRFLAARDPSWRHNRCSQAIAHDRRRKRRMIVQRGESTPHRGRWYPAETHFRRIAGPLWEAQMSSGVMHQIRVHAAFLGLPLLGDALYGGGQQSEGRYWLHHVGLQGVLSSEPLPLPPWAQGGDPGG